MRSIVLAGLCVLLAGSPALALDTGLILNQRLNVNLALPGDDAALTGDQAREAAARHVAAVLAGREGTAEGPMAPYWTDYKAVLARYPELSSARPVHVTDAEGKVVVARWLVGLRMNGPVGGFISVDPADGSIQSRLMFTPELKPLWMVPESTWNAAASINDIPELDELVPPYAQFTTGIPVDPQGPGVHLVDGILELPSKTQEERRQECEFFNNDHGTELNLTLSATKGRRTATSKCLSVAASYLADFWIATTGGVLPTYRNAVGGQKEYGVNPRHLECIYFKRARDEAGLGGKAVLALGDLVGAQVYMLAQFKLAGKDRVTGEPIPYAPRGYARILAETKAGTTPDNLAPSLISYPAGDNPFAMDQAPLLIVIDRNLTARLTRDRDERRYGADGSDGTFQIAPWNSAQMDAKEQEECLANALQTWGPLLAQHMKRDASGNAATGPLAIGVHACVIVGTVELDGRLHFVYRETFGDCSARYLEDSFLGPAYRAMPAEFFYQAIAFPHTLQLSLSDVHTAEDASLVGSLEIRTNRGRDLVDADEIEVAVDGVVTPHARFTSTGTGTYTMWLPIGSTANAGRIEIRASKRYFAGGDGKAAFTASMVRDEGGRRWVVETR